MRAADPHLIGGPPRYESLIEVAYTAQIVPGFNIQPDFQYFWNPADPYPDWRGQCPNQPSPAAH